MLTLTLLLALPLTGCTDDDEVTDDTQTEADADTDADSDTDTDTDADADADSDSDADTDIEASVLSQTFDTTNDVALWEPLADGVRTEAVLEWADGVGNPGGAMRIGATNDEAVGRAYIFQTDRTVDYLSATELQLSFDLKAEVPLSSTALHLQTNMPGAGVVNNFDIQNGGLNESGWTTYTYDFTGVDPSADTLSIHFNFAAGAVEGAGGSVLVDNVLLAPKE